MKKYRNDASKRAVEYQKTHKAQSRYSRLRSYSNQYIDISGNLNCESRQSGIKHLRLALKILKGRIAQATK